GGRYNPSSNAWVPTSPGVVPERAGEVAVWTGSEMVVWGGRFASYAEPVTNSGGKYNPAIDNWAATSTAPGDPAARKNATAEWTGTEMLVWGGQNANGILNTGGRYNPA